MLDIVIIVQILTMEVNALTARTATILNSVIIVQIQCLAYYVEIVKLSSIATIVNM